MRHVRCLPDLAARFAPVKSQNNRTQAPAIPLRDESNSPPAPVTSMFSNPKWRFRFAHAKPPRSWQSVCASLVLSGSWSSMLTLPRVRFVMAVTVLRGPRNGLLQLRFWWAQVASIPARELGVSSFSHLIVYCAKCSVRTFGRGEHLSGCCRSPIGISVDRTSRPWRFRRPKWQVVPESFEGVA